MLVMLQQITNYINKRLCNVYILALREQQEDDRRSHPYLSKHIVLAKVLNLPRLRWKQGHITNPIQGNKGRAQGISLDIIVSAINKTWRINRPLQHIKP